MEKECVVPFRCARAKQMTMTNVQQQHTHIANSVSVIWFKLGKFWDKIVSNFLLRSFKLLAIFFFDLKSWVHNCPQFNRHFTLSLCIETCVNCWNAEHRRISSTQALEFVNCVFFLPLFEVTHAQNPLKLLILCMVSNKSELWQMLVPTWDEENEIKMMTLQSCGFHFHCVSVLLFFHFLHFLPFVECKFVHFVSVVIVILHLLLLLYLFGYFLLSFVRFHLHRYLLNWLDLTRLDWHST